MPACGNPKCSGSTNIAEQPSFGSGKLDFYGFWEFPCGVCARAFEKAHPEHGTCWPPPSEAPAPDLQNPSTGGQS